MKNTIKKILFICTHNSARSQMAEGFVNSLLSAKFKAYSAGTEPREVNPYAIKVMKEVGIDISKQRAKSIYEFKGEKFDFAVTVCDHAKETCPFFPGAREYIHKGFEDPSSFEGTKEEKIKKFREIRDEIKDWIIKTFY